MNKLQHLNRVLTCPVCQSSLTIGIKTWHCDASKSSNDKIHSFDVAKQGYINLLQVQNKKSQNPGDSKDSIISRHEFLEAGFYEPLKQQLEVVLEQNLSQEATWLDIGCGEGYYTKAFYTFNKSIQTIAVDISKSAVMSLARDCKQDKRLWYQSDDTISNNTCVPIISSAAQLPIQEDSIDVVTSIFSPILVDELFRVLTDQGHLIIAKPDVGHLNSVRQELFDEIREHNSDKFLVELQEKGFELIEKQQISTEFALNAQQLANLLTMTPYSYRAKKEKRDGLLKKANANSFQTQAMFAIYLLKANKTK